MRSQRNIRPPRWAQRFIEWYCKPELAEDLVGDLDEYFERNVESKGVGRAKIIYIIDAIKFFRPYTVRRPNFVNVLINWIMIGSYIKTSGRNVMRNKLFSSINIVGLAISMSVGLMLISFLNDLNSYDKFHKNGDRIYRITSKPTFGKDEWGKFASTSFKTSKLAREKLSGIEDVATLRGDFGGDAVIGDNTVPIKGYWSDPSLFKVFTFPLIKGNEKTALEAPYSIVLTEESAKKLFGDKEALGQLIKFDTTEYQVTGVMKDVPFFSHVRFEALASLSTLERQNNDARLMRWTSMWGTYVYLLLPENADLSTLRNNLDAIAKVENEAIENTNIKLDIQPLNEVVLGEDLSNATGPTMETEKAWSLGILAGIVILSACFNYTNLSIARSLRRFKEVGLRKAIGANRHQVRQQFLYEAVIISLAALLLSFGLFLFMSRAVLELVSPLSQLVKLELSPMLVIYFVAFSIFVGVTAGFLPALFFARVNVIQALKDNSSVKVFKHLNLRRGLVVVQYTFTLAFITATIIGHKQYKNFLTFDLGYDTENIVNVKTFNNKHSILIKEFEEIPEVVGVSKSSLVTSVGSFWSSHVKYKNMNDSVSMLYDNIDENYLPMHDHKFVAGTNFKARPLKAGEETEVIVTGKTLERMSIGTPGKPETALGEQILLEGKKLSIIGVVENFHYGTLQNEIEPVVFGYMTHEDGGFINLKVHSSDLPATMAKIEEAWKKVDKIHPVSARFYDEALEEAYLGFSIAIKTIGVLAFLTISIASMGLFGMVVFTTETRLKEIGIRKVMGASVGSLVALLSRNFVFVLALSAAIAIPATYFIAERIFLVRFPYHAPVGMIDLFGGLAAVLAIAFLMIGTQTMKAARSNPAEVLKNE
ncbi:MAG: ABC transporter permease [Bacteroidota bacterium]